jgi:hypothetical protein
MPSGPLEPAMPAVERLQTYTLRQHSHLEYVLWHKQRGAVKFYILM